MITNTYRSLNSDQNTSGWSHKLIVLITKLDHQAVLSGFMVCEEKHLPADITKPKKKSSADFVQVLKRENLSKEVC